MNEQNRLRKAFFDHLWELCRQSKYKPFFGDEEIEQCVNTLLSEPEIGVKADKQPDFEDYGNKWPHSLRTIELKERGWRKLVDKWT